MTKLFANYCKISQNDENFQSQIGFCERLNDNQARLFPQKSFLDKNTRTFRTDRKQTIQKNTKK